MLRSKRHLSTQDNTVSLYRRLTARWRALPNAVIAGCQRCGTTSLYNYAIQHPLVTTTLWKEVHYFDRDRNFNKGQGWYRSHFALQRQLSRLARRYGHMAYSIDATPAYIAREKSMTRLADLVPEARIIVLIRNPADRAYSAYQNARRKGRDGDSFDEAVDREICWYNENAPGSDHAPVGKNPSRGYLTRGVYISQLRRLHRFFPAERTMIIRSEDLFDNVQRVYDALLSFLELPPHRLREMKARNASTYPSGMDSATRARLSEFFAPFNAQLSEYLQRDLDWA